MNGLQLLQRDLLPTPGVTAASLLQKIPVADMSKPASPFIINWEIVYPPLRHLSKNKFMLFLMCEKEVSMNCCSCLGFTMDLKSMYVGCVCVCVRAQARARVHVHAFFPLLIFLCFSHLYAFGPCLAEVLVFRGISQSLRKHLMKSGGSCCMFCYASTT